MGANSTFAVAVEQQLADLRAAVAKAGDLERNVFNTQVSGKGRVDQILNIGTIDHFTNNPKKE